MNDSRSSVLIVDDQPFNLHFLARILEHDFDVKIATNGTDALTLACRAPLPEVILLDVMMPGMDGYAVCAALKRNPITAGIPVIFVTARTDADSETAALAAGAADFLHKPMNPEVARARVRLQYELSQHRHHLEELVRARTLELAQARDAAESANRVKSAFLNNVSHEMRTPLNHITGMAYLLRGELPEGRGRERLAIIERSARLLLGLVEEVLDLSRLEAGEIELEAQPFDMRAWLDELIDEIQASANAKGLDVILSVDPNLPPRVIGDRGHLRQILFQILDNAVKFSEHGRIQVRVKASETGTTSLTLCFEVEDQGIGMTPELASRLFRPFQLGDDSLTRAHGGLGMGLALSQRLVALMGGAIRADSVQGRGTVIGVEVPLRPSHV